MLRFESNAVLWFNCHTVRTVPDSFVVLFKASDAIAVFQSGPNALLDRSKWVASPEDFCSSHTLTADLLILPSESQTIKVSTK